MKLTEQAISRLAVPEGKSELIIFDDDLPGFGVRCRAGGSRTYIAQYQIGRKQRRVSLGRVAGMPVDKARRAAGDILAKVRLGQDPQADKAKARAEAELTLGAVIDRFLEERQRPRLRPRTMIEAERHLRVNWKPLHGEPIANVDRSAIANQLHKLATSHTRTVADHARTQLSAFFTWAIKEGLAPQDQNPVRMTNRPKDPVKRERVLTSDEVREIWNHCIDDDFGTIVKLLLLTGQRREEIAGLRWLEVNRDEAMIELPPERTKNKRGHIIPLSDPALALLPEPRPGRDLVFGQRGVRFTNFSATKQQLDARILAARREHDPDAKPIPDWRLHDLRRTAATRMADLGVQPHIVEAVLNHYSGHRAGVAGIYNRAAYAKEKREALVLWGEHVMGLVGDGSKVVPFAKGGAA